MKSTSKKSTNGIPRSALLLCSIVLFAGSAWFVFAQYQSVRPPTVERSSAPEGAPPQPGTKPASGAAAAAPGPGFGEGRMPSPEERAKFREEIFASLNLTSEQREKMEAIDEKYGQPGSPEGFRERMEAVQAVLTEDQQQKLRTEMEGRREAMMKQRLAVLPPEEQKKFMEKMEARRAQFMQRMGENGGGGPWGPPPGAPPPDGGEEKKE